MAATCALVLLLLPSAPVRDARNASALTEPAFSILAYALHSCTNAMHGLCRLIARVKQDSAQMYCA